MLFSLRKIKHSPLFFIYLAIFVFSLCNLFFNCWLRIYPFFVLMQTMKYYLLYLKDQVLFVFIVVIFPYFLIKMVTFFFRKIYAVVFCEKPQEDDPFTGLKTAFLNTLDGLSFHLLIRFLLPLLLVFFLVASFLGSFNGFNKDRLKDETLLRWDYLITGTYPFIWIQSIHWPDWFVKLTFFWFINISYIMLGVGVIVFYFNKEIFKKYLSAFALAFLVVFPLWSFFPALSPHDRFIDNVYHLPLDSKLQASFKNYHPQTIMKYILDDIRSDKENLDYLPTTTFPSAHVVWILIVAYYLWQISRIIFYVALPVFVFSMLGTVFFAQHYFVDVIAGILLSFLIIYLNERHFSSLRKEH